MAWPIPIPILIPASPFSGAGVAAHAGSTLFPR
jgi:hypothetical protein